MVFHSDFQFPPLPTLVVWVFTFLTLLFLALRHSPFRAPFSISSSTLTICHLAPFPLLQPWFWVYRWLPWMFPEKELPEFFEERLPFSCLASLGITRERRGYGTKISQESSREEKNNNIYITDGLGSWIGSEGPFGDKPALNFTRKYPQIHKETYSHWLGISSLSTVGRYRWPALLLRMGPVFCVFFFFLLNTAQSKYIHFFFLSKECSHEVWKSGHGWTHPNGRLH